jgi:hypothetical protein
MSKTTPTQRSLALLRGRGYAVEKVEQRLTFKGFITRDLFGCIDLIAVRRGEIVGVQTTSRSNLAARRAKALGSPGLEAWLAGGGKFFLHGWGKAGPRCRRKTWQCSEQELTLEEVEKHQGRTAVTEQVEAVGGSPSMDPGG